MNKPLGTTLQEARKQQAIDRDRRMNSLGKYCGSPTYLDEIQMARNALNNEKKLKSKAKSTNMIGVPQSTYRAGKRIGG